MEIGKLQPGHFGYSAGHRDRLARNLVLQRLGRFARGSLSITEPDGNSVLVGESPPAGALRILDWRTYRMMLSGGAVGAAQAWMDGFWDSDELVNVVRFFAANVRAQSPGRRALNGVSLPVRALGQFMQRNSLSGSRRNIAAHYDLGNDFFRLFLDSRMMYSSAVFPRADAGLEEASRYKLDRICTQLGLAPGLHLLEIGTGWGGLAIHAARHYGCRVTTTTISREQYLHACRRVREEGLEARVTVLERDYRALRGRYDRIVSVEMIEAVGPEYLPVYFRRLGQLLEPDGLLLLQAITIPHDRYHEARWRMDFIKRYIFPGGFLPSLQVMDRNLVRYAGLDTLRVEEIGMDYARTLCHWRGRFLGAQAEVEAQGFDQRFRRMWEYYLCYCEGAFRERAIGAVQLLAGGRRAPEPPRQA